ncbi:hypothetical protein LHP98_09080 [Rhodobacter sp. Har01]|uniref:hypothetical protein n=1 Tax=Rhodobacter sp. Har01 TaxID=2883999 RepID=UPI001D06C539|nr:hypothetical protein [Rhodobacter sp. Har01]MCB6178282.1 hypothetical protein [Rhodobacter sp. Har01]
MPDDMPDEMPDDMPVIERPMPLVIRLGLMAAGAFAVVMPVWELGRGILPPNLLSPFFALIVGGGVAVGVAFVAMGLTGEGQVWRYPPGAVVIERRLWRKVWETRLTAADLTAVTVVRDASSDGPDTWVVRLERGVAPAFESHGFLKAKFAAAAAARIRAHLGMAGNDG